MEPIAYPTLVTGPHVKPATKTEIKAWEGCALILQKVMQLQSQGFIVFMDGRKLLPVRYVPNNKYSYGHFKDETDRNRRVYGKCLLSICDVNNTVAYRQYINDFQKRFEVTKPETLLSLSKYLQRTPT